MSLHNNYAQISCPSPCHPTPGTTHSPLATSTSSQECITLQSGVTAGGRQWVRLEARLAADTVPQLLLIRCSQNDPTEENLVTKVLKLIQLFLTESS